jgi:predicted TIM-barrel fold metal-dependent hydrolase
MNSNIPICDIHCHVQEPFAIVQESYFEPPKAENAENLTDYIKGGIVKKFAIPAITLYAVADLPVNPLALYAKTLCPGKIFALAGLRRWIKREDNAGMAEQAEKLMAAGFDGIKMICKPNVRRTLKYPVNDPIFDEFYAEAERQSWPILFHLADQIAFWHRDLVYDWAVESGWWYGDEPEIPTQQQLYDEMFAVLNKYPKLHITFAHFFWIWDRESVLRLDEINRIFETYPHVNFDLTPGGKMYDVFSRIPDKTRDMFIRWGDRIIFGTDNTSHCAPKWGNYYKRSLEKIANQRRFLETADTFSAFDFDNLHGLSLDKATLEKIYNKNFTRELGENPVPVNHERAAALCREYLDTIHCEEKYMDSAVRLLKELETKFRV